MIGTKGGKERRGIGQDIRPLQQQGVPADN